jgi:hypothetical protein
LSLIAEPAVGALEIVEAWRREAGIVDGLQIAGGERLACTGGAFAQAKSALLGQIVAFVPRRTTISQAVGIGDDAGRSREAIGVLGALRSTGGAAVDPALVRSDDLHVGRDPNVDVTYLGGDTLGCVGALDAGPVITTDERGGTVPVVAAPDAVVSLRVAEADRTVVVGLALDRVALAARPAALKVTAVSVGDALATGAAVAHADPGAVDLVAARLVVTVAAIELVELADADTLVAYRPLVPFAIGVGVTLVGTVARGRTEDEDQTEEQSCHAVSVPRSPRSLRGLPVDARETRSPGWSDANSGDGIEPPVPMDARETRSPGWSDAESGVSSDTARKRCRRTRT